jgi:carbon monoxide dehydrogenase subunit G
VKLEQSFEVDAPLEHVWSALIDVERVAPCLPGAAISSRNEDGSYDGTFTIKIGPTTASYAGSLRMEELDETSHSATMQANGTDKRGQGGASATIVSRLKDLGDDRTQVEVDTDYRITGRLARFGRGGMIEDISERLLKDFGRCLQESLGGEGPVPDEGAVEAEPAAPPAGAEAEEPAPHPGPPFDAGALVTSVLAQRLRRNPLPAAIGLALLIALAFRRRRR